MDDSTAFWCDCEGSGRPETMLKQEKRSTETRGFLVVEKHLQNHFCQILASILKSCWSPGPPQNVRINSKIPKGFFNAAGFVLGPLLGSF